ncbi:MAG: 2Fe-2S iron-sulfur cluster binding domain-containing protein [Theionarchaea archaeon]|nr:2Fe-2S iron-sulfur cluster binding domain-containing protein [Theionarchaea archaeon]MBU7000920.1 2Fe-2S iron-sulfur cluster binding domain-containing protein [Theionarchaea archaeon]MBU7021138.1 2Fe-2S iron-sulfur cluster binding domain-containing protein [Theionarchaea archaeon]MBU7033865.1 2Fe-2S iron-sulfur cluster binding domain-containing protein [Theionarchaea archaeon]MBU7041277.1 2Fe-2S iron-sulfur cluster binding domain-containing protein [Theionarchaea archaeon]
MTESALVSIFRFNPEEDDCPRMEEFEIPFDPQKTVLEALQYIYEERDGSLAFRESCKSGFCGTCGMIVNGHPCLACTTYMKKEMTIEPLARHRVIRDLVVELKK